MKKVYYIGHYALAKDSNEYKFAVPAKAKMDYIISAIQEAGCCVEVLSLSDSKVAPILKPKKECVANTFSVTHILSIKVTGKISRVISYLLKNFQLLFQILFKVRANDTVLVYHSLAYVLGIKVARALKKFKLVMDVEELYERSWGHSPKLCRKEESFLEAADAFLLVNDTIANIIDTQNKPSAVVYGSYITPEFKDISFNDNLIHVVYAGTIEENKRGAFTALEVANYLNDKYKLHILGFGKDKTIKKLIQRVDEINKQKGYEVASYDGFLSGNEFSEFLLKCSIGISSYIMNDDFSNSVFPSKLLTYVSHNLQVVAGYSQAFEQAKVSKEWKYFYEYEPKAIANAVLNTDVTLRSSNKNLVQDLHIEFVDSLTKIL